MHIQAIGDAYHAVDDTLPNLKEQVIAAVGQSVRRISRFMQLALIGAARCRANEATAKIPNDTAVYLASARGDLEITLEVMNQVFRDGQAPKPLSFVNTVSNSASFYVAKYLQLESRSNFVSNRYFAFESALHLALTDFKRGAIHSALIGSIDVAVSPLDVHRQRLQVEAHTNLGEASHWLWLSNTHGLSRNLGTVIDVYHAADRDSLLIKLREYLRINSLTNKNCCLSAGQFLSQSDFLWLQSITEINNVFDYRLGRAYYDSQSAAVISQFLSSPSEEKEILLHINGDTLGRYYVMLIRKQSEAPVS